MTETSEVYDESPTLATALGNSYQLLAGIACASMLGTSVVVLAVPASVRLRFAFAVELALVGVGLGVLAALLSRRTNQVVTAPVGELGAALSVLAAGDLSARVEVPYAATELRQVSDSVNVLAAETQRAKSAEAAALARLQLLERAHHSFLARVAAGLRSPLVGLVGEVELFTVADAETLKNGGRAWGSARSSDGEELFALLADVLPALQPELGVVPKREPIDLAAMFARVILDIDRAVAERSLVVDVEVDDGLQLSGDLRQIECAVLHVLSNAVAFSAEGTTITLSAHSESEEVVIDIGNIDLGPAPADPIDFDKWLSASKSARTGGVAGRGLYIVKQIANAHGGSVSWTAERGHTGLFKMRFPSKSTPEP